MKFSVLFLFSFSILWGDQPPPQPTPSPPQANLAVKTLIQAPDFHREVRNILERSCISCHGAESQKGGLRLDTLSLAKEEEILDLQLCPETRRKVSFLKEFIFRWMMMKSCHPKRALLVLNLKIF